MREQRATKHRMGTSELRGLASTFGAHPWTVKGQSRCGATKVRGSREARGPPLNSRAQRHTGAAPCALSSHGSQLQQPSLGLQQASRDLACRESTFQLPKRAYAFRKRPNGGPLEARPEWATRTHFIGHRDAVLGEAIMGYPWVTRRAAH